jgi:hypothetical protein
MGGDGTIEKLSQSEEIRVDIETLQRIMNMEVIDEEELYALTSTNPSLAIVLI